MPLASPYPLLKGRKHTAGRAEERREMEVEERGREEGGARGQTAGGGWMDTAGASCTLMVGDG